MGGVSLNGVGGGGSNAGGTNLFRDSITSASLLLEGVDPECVAWAHANSSGCRIALKDTAVNLTIPEGALNKTEELFCALLTEDKDRPQLRGKWKTTYEHKISCLAKEKTFHVSCFSVTYIGDMTCDTHRLCKNMNLHFYESLFPRWMKLQIDYMFPRTTQISSCAILTFWNINDVVGKIFFTLWRKKVFPVNLIFSFFVHARHIFCRRTNSPQSCYILWTQKRFIEETGHSQLSTLRSVKIWRLGCLFVPLWAGNAVQF